MGILHTERSGELSATREILKIMSKKKELDEWHRRVGAYIAKVEIALSKPNIGKKERDEVIGLGQDLISEALYNNF